MQKDDARDSRLSIKSYEEKEVLKRKLQLEARQICGEYSKSFRDCAKLNGMMVVFKCRNENTAS